MNQTEPSKSNYCCSSSYPFPLHPFLKFYSVVLSAGEHEAKPQNLTEDGVKKKQKKLKKISNVKNAITGFEAVFEQFAKGGIRNSDNAMVSDPEVGNPLTPQQSDKLDVSDTEVIFFMSEGQ